MKLGVKKEYLDAVFDEMQKKYGSIEKCCSDGLQIDAAKQKALVDALERNKGKE